MAKMKETMAGDKRVGMPNFQADIKVTGRYTKYPTRTYSVKTYNLKGCMFIDLYPRDSDCKDASEIYASIEATPTADGDGLVVRAGIKKNDTWVQSNSIHVIPSKEGTGYLARLRAEHKEWKKQSDMRKRGRKPDVIND